ncbi:MAG: hypothetical protein GWN85_45235, partial [Gemmatimonadetes bacterium]|nr:hypothetical protein [Gemmatimonadota bacterium]NIR42372.1 hypothetical protein [Actinomycetota bacterium]NIW33881.1 hypothetical protein [Actinomycetota bacterium]NIX26021.1 hypothetical protein [Actinomycetota bacterium]
MSAVGILSAIAAPAYRDYTIRAKYTELIGAFAVPKIAVHDYIDNHDDFSAIADGVHFDFQDIFGYSVQDGHYINWH